MKGVLGKLFSKKLEDQEQKVVDDIREYGCQVEFVFDPEGKLPDFSYSIGFPVSVRQPEVIVFGLRQEVMHSMVNEMRRKCADGLVLKDWESVNGLIEGFDCILRRVTDQRAIKEHFGWAIWYHRSQRNEELSEAYQLVWPGAVNGLFPWNEGCAQNVVDLQPALYDDRTLN